MMTMTLADRIDDGPIVRPNHLSTQYSTKFGFVSPKGHTTAGFRRVTAISSWIKEGFFERLRACNRWRGAQVRHCAAFEQRERAGS
jgi:hypothetical protein